MTSKRNQAIADRRVLAALGMVLDEFGGCDLEPRLKYFAGHDGDDDHDKELRAQGRRLGRAWNVVEAWHRSNTD
jgi:hypothetical protein